MEPEPLKVFPDIDTLYLHEQSDEIVTVSEWAAAGSAEAKSNASNPADNKILRGVKSPVSTRKASTCFRNTLTPFDFRWLSRSLRSAGTDFGGGESRCAYCYAVPQGHAAHQRHIASNNLQFASTCGASNAGQSMNS